MHNVGVWERGRSSIWMGCVDRRQPHSLVSASSSGRRSHLLDTQPQQKHMHRIETFSCDRVGVWLLEGAHSQAASSEFCFAFIFLLNNSMYLCLPWLRARFSRILLLLQKVWTHIEIESRFRCRSPYGSLAHTLPFLHCVSSTFLFFNYSLILINFYMLYM